MIRRIRLRDFKTHVDTTVELGRLTVLVGPNGAGKSSVLTALHLFEEPTPARDAKALTRFGAKEFRLGLEGDDWRARITPPQAAVLSIFAGSGPADEIVRTFESSDPQQRSPRSTLDATYLRLDGRRLAEPAKPTERPRLEPDGRGLAAVIAEMILSGSERFPAIVDDIRKVVPQVRGLRVRTVSVPLDGGGTEGRMELLVDFEGARGVPAHAVSEGTLIAIGLLTVLHGEPRPKLLLLDDIDQALHPKAQWALVAALRRVLELDPELQVVATTHSPYLVDELKADEVRVLALDAQGVTRCRALSDHPRAGALLDVLSTGELLGSEGEDWVVGAGDD